jgi:putative nucleotidyltransferase with HDIG domain
MGPLINIFRRIESAVFKSIRFKLSIFILVLLVITTFVFYIFTARMMDFLGIDNTMYRLKNLNSDVEYIAVVDPDMKAITHTDIKKVGKILSPAEGQVLKKGKTGIIITEVPSPSGTYFEIVNPIIFKDKQLGTIILGINKSVLFTAKRRARDRILAGFSITFLLGIVGIIFLSHFITRPIKELSSGVEELKEGKGSRPLKVYSNDELGKLTKSFNKMAELITEQKQNLSKYAQELEEAYVSTVKVLAAAIDARDPYTHGHSTRVAKLSVKLGEAIGLSKKQLEDLEIACLFHDVGKIKTPDLILQKNDQLDSTEYSEMMRHPEYGAEILSKAPSLEKYIPSVRHHHEWYNGNGYPDRLTGEKIPLFAAIISIADAFDSMTTTRPYRNAFSDEEALGELAHLSGKQFNPHLVEVFIQVMNKYQEPIEQTYETK